MGTIREICSIYRELLFRSPIYLDTGINRIVDKFISRGKMPGSPGAHGSSN